MSENESLWRLLDKISYGMGLWYEESFTKEQNEILERLLRAVQSRRPSE